MATSTTSNGSTTATTDLTSFYKNRFISPSELISTYNPQRLGVYGLGTDGIGGDPASTGPFYVFVTKPDTNILSDAARKYFGIGQPTAPENIATLLTNGGASGVIKLLTNLCESYSVSDIALDTHSIGEAWDGAKLVTPKSTLNSKQDGTLQLEFQEWSGLPITTLHRFWVDYIEAVTRGILSPKANPNYILYRILDYACSIYAFQLLPDASTIEFGVRFTGCFPTSIPLSQNSGKLGNSESIKVSVPYAYSYMEAMDPAIFYEFNTSAANTGVSISSAVLTDSKRKVFKLSFAEGKTLENFL
jgi:hypothetical protein